MSTEESMETNHQSPNAQLPGDILRQKREEKGMSLDDVSASLCLRSSVINELETHEIGKHHAATFVRGYYRNYAKLLGIPEAVILEAADRVESAKIKEQQMQTFSPKSTRAKHNRRVSQLSWVIFIAIAGISIVLYWQANQENKYDFSQLNGNQTEQAEDVNQESSKNLTDESANTSSLSDDNEELDDDISSNRAPMIAEKEAISDMASLNAAKEQADDAKDSPSDAQKADDSTNADKKTISENELVISFSGDCWMQVKGADGKVLESGLKKSGDEVKLSDQKLYKVTLGAPNVAKISFQGEAVDLSKFSNGRVARLTLEAKDASAKVDTTEKDADVKAKAPQADAEKKVESKTEKAEESTEN